MFSIWRHVFDSSKQMWANRTEAARAAWVSGYKFLAFNGTVYFLAVDPLIGSEDPEAPQYHFDTGITVEEVTGG